jgi:glycosyltransferase involved in cell wall biosynthesis
MNVFILTIHHPEISFGPEMRLQGFLKSEKFKQNVTPIFPKFVYGKQHTKFDTFMVLVNSIIYITKNRKKIDMIHAVTPPSYIAPIAILAKKLFKIPYIVDIGDPYAENMAEIKNFSHKSCKFKILKHLDNSLYKNADHLVLTSEGITKYISHKIPHTTILTAILHENQIVENKNTTTTPPATTTSPTPNLTTATTTSPTPNLTTATTTSPTSNNPPINKKCIYLGLYGPLQNFEYILKIFIEAIKKDKEITLDIVGQGEKQKCEGLINQCSETDPKIATEIKKNIKFQPPIPKDKIPELLKNYACGIVSLKLNPNLDYAIPTKLLTYLSYGLPVFGTGGISSQKLIKNSKTGYISAKYNIKKDSEKLISLLKNQEKLLNFSKNAEKFAKENLSIEHAGNELLKIYSATLSKI